MTDLVFYGRMSALATKLLTKFGGPVSVVQYGAKTVPDATGIAQPGTPTTLTGLGCVTLNEQVLTTMNTQSDDMLIAQLNGIPKVESIITLGTQAWKIMKVKRISPDGATILVYFLAGVLV